MELLDLQYTSSFKRKTIELGRQFLLFPVKNTWCKWPSHRMETAFVVLFFCDDKMFLHVETTRRNTVIGMNQTHTIACSTHWLLKCIFSSMKFPTKPTTHYNFQWKPHYIELDLLPTNRNSLPRVAPSLDHVGSIWFQGVYACPLAFPSGCPAADSVGKRCGVASSDPQVGG